jgi:trehalose 6-phosphate phosphatase
MVPSPLPPKLLPDLVRRTRILVCLDYDGTISEIAEEPQLARPVRGVVQVLQTLARHRDLVPTALVTGRTVADLRTLISLPPEIQLAGVHGLQLLGPNGEIETASEIDECRDDLQSARLWLSLNLPENSGFIVEDKGVALALHYRQVASPVAHSLRDSFEHFIVERTPSLRPRHGKLVIEALPRIASKANAVRSLCTRAGAEFEPVYFGDDLTDEDAFNELAARGIAVLVGEPRRSAARYRVGTPADVVCALSALAAALDPRHG